MVILEKNHSHNMATTVVVFTRNPCFLTVAAFAAATLRLVHTPTHLYMHGIQHQWKIITVNALKTTSIDDLVISAAGMFTLQI